MVGYGDIDCSVLYKWVIYQQYDNRGHESPSGYVVRSQLRVVNVTILPFRLHLLLAESNPTFHCNKLWQTMWSTVLKQFQGMASVSNVHF